MLLYFWIFAFSAFLISFRKDRQRTVSALQKGLHSSTRLLSSLLGMIAFMGLTLAVLSTERLASFLMNENTWNYALAPLIGAIVTIPGPIAFPLAGALLNRGVHPTTLASLMTTMTMVGMASSSVEISHFGQKFTWFRQTLNFIAAVLIGSMMGVFL